MFRRGFSCSIAKRNQFSLKFLRQLKLTIALTNSLFSISLACTIGVFSSISTQSRLPLLWKNRDIPNPDQAVYFFNDGIYQYLGLVYAGDSNRVWAGINEKGFAIINSTSGNIGSGVSNGLDDGEVIKFALQNCASIEEFQLFMDSTNLTGRQTPSNFGVLDSTGEASIFEAGGTSYVRWDASNESLGFMLRANYSMSGDTTRRTGYVRYLRAMELAEQGYQTGVLDAQYIIEKIGRDLGSPGFDPYPLPYRDTVGSYPPGFLPTTASVNRNRTRACVVIVGKGQDTPNEFFQMWTVLSEPCVGIALPMFFAAKAVPEPISGYELPKICALGQAMREYVYMGTDFGINTFLLAPIHDEFHPLETEIFLGAQEQISKWQDSPPTATEIFEFEESLCERVVEAYEQFNFDKERVGPLDLTNIIIKPNPGFDRIKFTVNRELQGAIVKVYNIKGKLVDEFLAPENTEIFFWIPKKLSSGIYFIHFNLGETSVTKKLIIEK